VIVFFQIVCIVVGGLGVLSLAIACRISWQYQHDCNLVAQEIRDCLKEGDDACVENT